MQKHYDFHSLEMNWINPFEKQPKENQLCWLFILGRAEYHLDLNKDQKDHQIVLGIWKTYNASQLEDLTTLYKETIGYWENLEMHDRFNYAKVTSAWEHVIAWIPFEEMPLPELQKEESWQELANN